MTVIAWDGKTLAADRQITSGYTKNKRITKIRKYGNVLCGVTGETKYADALFKWVEGGRIKVRFPSFSNDNQVMLVVIDVDILPRLKAGDSYGVRAQVP